jgi:hypothetical protein
MEQTLLTTPLMAALVSGRLIQLQAQKLRLLSRFIREAINMAGQTTLDELVALMAEFRGDLHAMAKGHPFTLQEVDAALQEASPGGAEAVCLSVLRAHAKSE